VLAFDLVLEPEELEVRALALAREDSLEVVEVLAPGQG